MRKISLIASVLMVFLFSCQKNIEKQATQEEMITAVNQNKNQGHLQQTKIFSSDVVIRWLKIEKNNNYNSRNHH